MLSGAAGAGQLALWPALAHLGAVTAAGLVRPAAVADGAGPPLGITVVVPAHDEEQGLPATLASLRAATPPSGGLEVVVVADHCTDRTADVARAAGVEVWERHADGPRGKGGALRWAFDRLLAQGGPDAVAVVDADTVVDPDVFVLAERRLRAGAECVQVRYLAAEPPSPSTVSRLAAVSAACQSVLRPRGRARLGGAAKLQGNGMVFRREVLQRVPWDAYGVAEDVGYWFRLLRSGVRPVHEPRAGVHGAMPEDLAAARVQRARWEQGRAQVAREQVRPALRQACRERDVVLAEAVLSELVVPPLAVLTAAVVGCGAVRVLAAPEQARGRAACSLGAQVAVVAAHVVAALQVAQAPPATYGALAAAPGVVAWKLAVKAGTALRPAGTWQRTPR